MNASQLEELYIRSLDVTMSDQEKESFLKNLQANPELAKELARHKKVRDMVRAKTPASFGPYFAVKLVLKIQNTGVVIDRQIFAFFKKYQLVALGIIVGLLALNIMFSEQASIKEVLGLDRITNTEDVEVESFDFSKTFN